jgi:hypothetical protein
MGFGLVAAPLSGDGPNAVRQKLAEFQRAPTAGALDYAWPYLDSPDATIRQAARKAVQAQPFPQWKDRAIEEKATWASLELLRALVESCPADEAPALSPHLCEQITTLRFESMDPAQMKAAVRVTRLVFERLGPVSEDERQQMVDLWSHLAAPSDAAAAADLRALLEYLRNVRPRRS